MNTIWIVLPILIVLMFQLGIELDRQAFAGVFRRPAAVVAGLAGQLLVLSAWPWRSACRPCGSWG